MRRSLALPALAVLAATLSAVRAAADVVQFRKEPAFPNVRIEQLTEGQVRFRLTRPTARTLEKPIAALAFVQITGAAEFNRAEQYVRAKNDLKAIPKYERALRRFNVPWKKSLVRVRLVSAYDRAGRFDRAVETFVQLVNEMGPGALGLEPKHLPGPKSRYYGAALAALDRALKTDRKPRVRDAVVALKNAIQASNGDGAVRASPAGRPKREKRNRSVAAAGGRRTRTMARLEAARVARIEEAVQAKQYAAAQHELDTLVHTASPALLPTVRRLRAQVGLQTAKNRDDLLRAGVEAMRVVVRFPDHREVPACLFVAARVHERIGRRKLAASLLRECRNHGAVTPELSKQAERALARLEADDAPE